MKTLSDILACPICRNSLIWNRENILCNYCKREFKIIDDVPVFINIEDPLTQPDVVPKENYDQMMVKSILKTLDRRCIVLDIGSGEMHFDDPNIIRLENHFTPHVDVVADARKLPFKDGVVDFVHSAALIEHLDDPLDFGRETWRVCSWGGYCYAETNFLWPYHAYPSHYFNSSISGIEKVFSHFRKVRSGVPPHGYPPFALRVIIEYFLALFKPSKPTDFELIKILEKSRELLEEDFKFNHGFNTDNIKMLAGVVYFYGIKQMKDESIIPYPILDEYNQNKTFQELFSNPFDLMDEKNIWNELREVINLSHYYSDKQIFAKHAENLNDISDPILK